MTQETKEHQNFFEPYMKHYGRTPEEQLEKNKPLMEKLRKWIEENKAEEISEEEAKARAEYWEEFKKTIDSFRPEGHKLYSEE
ncbi:hypothetical protein [Cyanothece sp. BG0011]|uniref:hypothetical protein n=1 Tax=Cyanothece sp. BG0011 TaxID=2082950 RepID=UPI000D1E1DEE|nr:hypothetical protein [Cyanothece sp. BG0011]